jgi:hypothetical protein
MAELVGDRETMTYWRLVGVDLDDFPNEASAEVAERKAGSHREARRTSDRMNVNGRLVKAVLGCDAPGRVAGACGMRGLRSCRGVLRYEVIVIDHDRGLSAFIAVCANGQLRAFRPNMSTVFVGAAEGRHSSAPFYYLGSTVPSDLSNRGFARGSRGRLVLWLPRLPECGCRPGESRVRSSGRAREMDMMIDIDPHPVELLELDRLTVWPPYSPMPATALALPVVSASGVRLPDGRDLIDRIPSWWRAVARPAFLEAVRAGLAPGLRDECARFLTRSEVYA